MALLPLELSTTTGSIGRAFSAALWNFTAGGRLEILPHPAGFYVNNGRVHHRSTPAGVTSFTVRETHPTEGRKDTTFTITAQSPDVLDRLTADIPAVITSGGSATLRRRAGSTLRMMTNPNRAWTLNGDTLSWSAAAIGSGDRPVIVETANDTGGLPVARETRLSMGTGRVDDVAVPANAIISPLDGQPLTSPVDGSYLLGVN